MTFDSILYEKRHYRGNNDFHKFSRSESGFQSVLDNVNSILGFNVLSINDLLCLLFLLNLMIKQINVL